MTSKVVSRNFMKIIFMSMMTSKVVSRNFMKILQFFMSMIVTMRNEVATTDKVWAIITAHFTENWGFYTLLTRCSLSTAQIMIDKTFDPLSLLQIIFDCIFDPLPIQLANVHAGCLEVRSGYLWNSGRFPLYPHGHSGPGEEIA